MEGALSPSDASADLICSHFPFPPGADAGKCILICGSQLSPQTLDIFVFFATQQQQLQPNTLPPGPGTSPVPPWLSQTTAGFVPVLGTWFVSAFPVFLPSFRETFRLDFILDAGNSGAVSCL